MKRQPAQPSLWYKIYLQIDEEFAGDVPPALLRAATRAALKHQNAPRGSLSLIVSGDATLRQLNKKFLNHDYATDVLSFPAEAHPQTPHYFGDIVISYPRALAQAQSGGHEVKAELQLLTVHGVLHLLGHDHYSAKDKTKMWRAQSEILALLKCEITEPKLVAGS